MFSWNQPFLQHLRDIRWQSIFDVKKQWDGIEGDFERTNILEKNLHSSRIISMQCTIVSKVASPTAKIIKKDCKHLNRSRSTALYQRIPTTRPHFFWREQLRILRIRWRNGKKTKKEPPQIVFSICRRGKSLHWNQFFHEEKKNIWRTALTRTNQQRLLCYCSAADISAGRQIGN